MAGLGVNPVGWEQYGVVPQSPLGPSVEGLRPVPGYGESTGLGQSQIARGIAAAYGGAKAGLQAYGASIADAAGAQQAARDWYDYANATAHQAELNGPRVRSLGQALTPEDYLDYTLGKVGEFAPYLVGGGALGLVGRGVGATAGLRGAQLARAGHLAGTAGFQPLMAGDQALALHNDEAARNMSPQEVLLRSQGVGAAQAYVGAAVPSMMGGRLLTRAEAPTIGRTVGQVLGNSVAGGAGMAGMDVIGQAHRAGYDPSYQFDPTQTGEAFTGGVAGMLPIAGVHGAVTHGLDKGANLPGKVVEEGKREAQRLYEAAASTIPDGVKDVLRSAASKAVELDQDAGAYWDKHLAKEFEAAGDVAGVAKAFFVEHVVDLRKDLQEHGNSIAEVESILKEAGHRARQAASVAGKTLSQVHGDTRIGKLLADDPAVPQNVKKTVAAAKGGEAKLEAVAEAMSDPGKWFDRNLTAADLKAHKEALKHPMLQAAFLDDVVQMLNDHAQDTAAANQIRDLYKRVKSGEPLSDADAVAMYITAKLALQAQGTERGIIGAAKVFENTRKAQQRTGKTIPGEGEVEEVQYAKGGPSFHDNTMQAALAVADTSPELARDIARRVQLLDIRGDGLQRKGRGADIVVREAVSAALSKHGIDPQANGTFTKMYNKVLASVNERLGELPKGQSADEIAANVDAFKARVQEHVNEMLTSTDVGRQLMGSPKIADSVADFVGKLAMGHPEYTQRAATRMFTQIVSHFGDVGRTAIDKVIDAADNAFGSDSRAAARVGMLRENVSSIYDVAVEIGKTVKTGGQVEHTSGNMVPNYKLIGELLEDLDLTRRVDSKREAMIASRREALSKRNKSFDFDERERLGQRAQDIADALSRHGIEGLRERWVGEGVVDAKKFNQLVGLVEKYDRHGDRLDRPERRSADHIKSAGRTVENISHEDPDYIQATHEGVENDSESPLTPTEFIGRTGAARDELIEKRSEEKYGARVEKKSPARFVGAEIFDTKVYNPKAPTLGAPVTMHAAGDRATSYNSKRSEFGAMAEEAHTVYGHALVDSRSVRMDAWAEEMATERGGTPQQHLNDALDALLAHDQRRLETGKLTSEQADFVTRRAEMADRLRDKDAAKAGESFFASPMNRSYRYYRVEQGDNRNISYSADQLQHVYAVPEGMTAAQYATREAQKRGPFAPKVYEDSLLPVEFTDGKTHLIDIAKLVHDTMRRHQIGDTAGVGDKRVTADMGQQILDTFHTVMGTLMLTDGVKRVLDISEGGKMFVAEDAPRATSGVAKKFGQKEEFSQHFDPSLVIFREAVPHKTQVAGEPVEDVGVKRFFALGQLSQIAGMDALGKTKRQGVNKMTLPVTDRVPGQQPVGPGVFRKQDMSRIMTKGEKVPPSGLFGQNGRAEPERIKKAREAANKRGVALNGLTRVIKEKTVDDSGTVVKPFVGDNVAYSVDLHALLVRMLERNNIEPHEALVNGSLPLDTAGMLLREAFRELKSMGYDGVLFDNTSDLFDTLRIYTRFEFGRDEPVTLKDLKNRRVFDLEGKRPSDGAKFPIVTPRNLEDARLHEVLSDVMTSENAESVAKRKLDEGYRDLSLTSPEMAKRRAERIEEAHSRTEWGLWRDPAREKAWDYSDAALALGRLTDRLGGTRDIPLHDKAEAVGGDRSVERNHRITGDEKVMATSPLPGNAVLELYDRLQRTARDLTAAKAIEDTFFLNDKGFEKWLSERQLKTGTDPRRASKASDVSFGEKPLNSNLTEGEKAATRREAAYIAKRDLTESARAERRAVEKVQPTEAVESPAPEAEAEVKAAQVDIAGVIKDFSSREPKSPSEVLSLVKTLSDSQLQEFMVGLPSLAKTTGTVAEQAIRRLSVQTGVMAEWAKAQRERAGVEFDGGRFKKIGEEDAPFSKQQRTSDGREVSQAEAEAIAKKLLGDIVPVTLHHTLGADSDGLKIVGRFVNKSIELVRSPSSFEMNADGTVINTGGASSGTLYHEIWHAVESMLNEMGPHGKKILADIHAHVNTPLMRNWLKENYNDAGVESQLDSMSERAAFVFQKLSAGVKMPMVQESKSILQRLADFVRWVGSKVGFKTTTAHERSDNFMDYVMRGDFARDMDNAASVRKGLGEGNGDSIVHQAGQILKPGLEALTTVFQHTATRVADLKIPEYDTVMELLTGAGGKGGYMNDKRRMEYAFDNKIGEQIKGLSEEQMQEFRTGRKFREFQGELETYMANAGVESHQVEQFYNRLATLNADAIGRDIEAFITDLVNHGGFRGKAGEARTLANQISDRGFYYNKDRDLFPNRPDLKEKWAEREFGQAMARYIQQAVHLAEQTRERTGNDGKTYRMSDLGALLEAGNAKADSAGQQLMSDTLAAYEGTLGANTLSPGLRKFMGSLLFINNVRLLPKAVFSQMLEPMQLALRKGSMAGTLDTLWRGIREMPRSFDKLDAGYTPDKWEKLANQIGTAPSRIIANVMAQMQNGMTLPGKIGHWNDQFFKLNFMDQWNRSMHVEATKHAVEFLNEHAENVRTGKNEELVKRSQRYLNELGVKASDIKTDGDGGLYIDIANVGSDRVARAISQYVNEAMAHPDAGSNPMWMNDPRFALLAQMKRFTFAHSKFVLDRGIKEYRLGNAFPLVPAVLAMPWMLAADGLRDTLTMTDTSYKKNWGIMDHMEHAWSRAGHAGRGQFFADMEQSIRHGGSGVEGAAGPTAELFGRFARGMHTGRWFDSMVNQVPGAPMIMPD